MDLFLRRNRYGLGTLRAISSKMRNPIRITNDDVNYSQNALTKIFLWGSPSVNDDVLSTSDVHNRFVREITHKGRYRINNTYNFSNSVLDIREIPTSTGNLSSMIDFIRSLFRRDGVEEKTFIFRPSSHYGAKDFHIIKGNFTDCVNQLNTVYQPNHYISEFIPKVQEFRVFVMHGRVLFVIEKIVDNKDTYAWNVAEGGKMVNVKWSEWNKSVVMAALFSNHQDNLDYGAYDVLVDTNGYARVLEVNTSARVEEDYWSSCLAKGFDFAIDQNIVANSKIRSKGSMGDIAHHYLRDSGKGFWKLVIHPAISNKAVITRSLTDTNRASEFLGNIGDSENSNRAPITGNFAIPTPNESNDYVDDVESANGEMDSQDVGV